jgi:Ca2+-binding RTX toxin-like protein
VDTVYTSVSYTLTPGADVETLATIDETDTAAINLTGNASGNQIIGNDGNNVINGGGGVDQMTGRGGNDTYFVDNATDTVTESGGQGIDTVRTSVSWTLTAGADVEILRTTSDFGAIDLTGNSSGNVVIGNNASNILNGRDGNDELWGGSGHDSFLFDTALDAAFNVDIIADFDVPDDTNLNDDTILLDDAVFSSSLGLGNISAGEFVTGATAQDANDRIIYDDVTGALFYDSDGNGGTAAIQFAELTPGLALTNLDFLVV